MSKPLVSEDFWAAIAPLLQLEPLKPKGGRPRCEDRVTLTGVIFVQRHALRQANLKRAGPKAGNAAGEYYTAGSWRSDRQIRKAAVGADGVMQPLREPTAAPIRSAQGPQGCGTGRPMGQGKG